MATYHAVQQPQHRFVTLPAEHLRKLAASYAALAECLAEVTGPRTQEPSFAQGRYEPQSPDLTLTAVATETASVASSSNLFRRQGNLWLIRFAGKSIALRSTKGLGQLRHLLASPGQAILVADLAAVTGDEQRIAMGSRGQRLDRQAIAEYRQRIEDLEEDLADAQMRCDLGRQEEVQAEIEALRSEVAAAVGLGGRIREDLDAERYRKAVSMAIGRAIQQIESEHAELGRHLFGSIQMGRFFSYRPANPVAWLL